ncbi:MAG: hypothetical protein GWN99_14390 [Gemmatimonadetes bacterium]|uniref:Outer membrane protein beta-barrel domain-containing protein n=1 Tax=Candidatus Kutchimonas denitrificans TaxID=3056748 RepID=A0AAE4ZBA4_9BACT|nr:hypothetical protein [Gemmatimonadota bacterium]NIR76042.1 hypothetical protein [Candidatus Kutchimonas denitrificans]NIS02234.1 hypothetical protein [Gemmatimonadota bacterium]NIT68060.1 hypothetical protein [Gemmatimonadota bacterium]NIU54086.1 hypothetical protein [Gemmatimonadota bacterium]
MTRRIALVVVLFALSATPLPGQVGLSGFSGGYLPLRNLFDAVRVGGETGPVIVNLGQEPGVLLGGRLSVRILSRLGVEVEASYALSALDLPPTSELTVDDSNVLLASLNATWIFFKAPFSPMSLYLSGGFGVAARSGDFWVTFRDTSSFAGAFGLGLRYGLTPLLFLRFDLRNYVYSFEPTAGAFTFESKTQSDLMATLALEFALTPAR